MSSTVIKENAVSLNACTDCIMLLANGQVMDGEGNDITAEIGRRIAMLWGDAEITLGALRGECDYCPTDENADCEPWFTYSGCECCGSSLGGNRQHVTVWVRDTE